jgi:sigma-B regulation protein RsbU (phosphoserine phosphatase)
LSSGSQPARPGQRAEPVGLSLGAKPQAEGSAKPADRSAWRRLLELGQQLVAQPTVAAQRELIVATAARLLEARADLWLAEPLRRLPGLEKSPSPAPKGASDLMRRALETRQICPGREAESCAALAAAVPLVAHDTVLGVLEVRRADGPPFSDAEIELLDGLATQSASALQAARQVAIARWRAEQLSLVRSVSAQVADILDLDELCRRVTNSILHTFDYYYVALFTLEPGQDVLRCRASAGPTCPQPRRGEASPVLAVQLGEGIIGHVAQAGAEILANEVGRDPRYRPVDALPETRSEAALPLKIEDRVLGVLDVQSDQPDDFDETDMLVLRALADQIAIAVEDTRLYEDSRRRADQLSAVAEVSRAVTSILDIDALLNQVVTLIHRQFEYPFVYLFTVDPARGQIVYRAGSVPPDQAPQAGGLTCSLHTPENIVSWVACHGETVLANDVSRDPRYRPLALPPADTRSELAVPLIFGDGVLGVLDVQSDRQDAFGDDDRFLFQALASSVAIAIRNANLYRSERWRRQVADSLREVAGLLSADVALDQVLDAILTELERTLPCDVAAIWLLHEDDLCLSAVHGYEVEVCISDFSADVGPWLTQALRGDQPIIRTPQSPSEPLGAALGFPSDYSAIAAPLRAGDRRLGVLTLAHRSPGRYGAESRMITTAFASYAAVAIENTRLYRAAQEQAWISTVMLQVAEATQSLTTLDQVLEAVVRLAPMLAGVDRCALLLWDESTGAFVPAAAYGLSPVQQAVFARWRIAPGSAPAFDHLRLDHTPVLVQDAASDPRLPGEVISTFGFRSLLLLPLLAHGEAVGAMLFEYQGDQAEFRALGTLDDERMALIQGIAHQTAAAVENARLLEAQQEEAYVSAALLQVAQAVASLSNLDEILSTIVRIVPLLVGVERCILFLWDDEQSVFRPAQAYGVPRRAEEKLLAQCYAPGDFPLLDAVRGRDRPIVRPADAPPDRSIEKHEPIPPDFAADFLVYPQGEPNPLVGVPLLVKGDVLGVMVLEEAQTSHRSRGRRLEIITGIAHQAALAVQNDRLQQEMAERERLERELQLAREIQQTFMPGQLPHLPGWELAFTWRAARQVAGDFYDFFELSGGRLGLVIADVADKGMPAALFMALTRTLMRAAALEEVSPAAALARVNDLLVPDAHQGMFVTAVYAVLSLDTGRLTYANAGHNLPLLLRSGTGELEWLSKGGMALGVLEGVRLEEHAISLEPGDSLVFYTDGVTEAFSPGGDIYGEERLRATLWAAKSGSAQAVLDAIDASVVAFAGDAPPSDDRTLMVLRRME